MTDEEWTLLSKLNSTLNNAPAFQRLQRFQVENLIIQQAQTFILGGDSVFVITGTAALRILIKL